MRKVSGVIIYPLSFALFVPSITDQIVCFEIFLYIGVCHYSLLRAASLNCNHLSHGKGEGKREGRTLTGWPAKCGFYHFPPKLESLTDSAPEHRMALCPGLQYPSHLGLTSLCSPRSFSEFQCQVLGFLNLFLFLMTLPKVNQGKARIQRQFTLLTDPAKHFLGFLNCILVLTYKMCLKKHVCPEIFLKAESFAQKVLALQ